MAARCLESHVQGGRRPERGFHDNLVTINARRTTDLGAAAAPE
jgi:hypothetical protein